MWIADGGQDSRIMERIMGGAGSGSGSALDAGRGTFGRPSLVGAKGVGART